mgnify:CR=1|tara:strand:- start:463 stop:633 length:171 start_codon:yes stop_codon:yes gene_type:complete
MDINKWKSVAIRREIVEMAADIGKRTERPTSNVFAFAVKRLKKDIDAGRLSEVPKQ